jgi:hypothetical protein
VPDPNTRLRAARERLPSLTGAGEPASRQEIAEAVNAFLWRETGRRYEFDSHHPAKLERGVIGWPTAPYRAALRAVLHASCDDELDFSRHAALVAGARRHPGCGHPGFLRHAGNPAESPLPTRRRELT